MIKCEIGIRIDFLDLIKTWPTRNKHGIIELINIQDTEWRERHLRHIQSELGQQEAQSRINH